VPSLAGSQPSRSTTSEERVGGQRHLSPDRQALYSSTTLTLFFPAKRGDKPYPAYQVIVN
jgi:hypothetical protein